MNLLSRIVILSFFFTNFGKSVFYYSEQGKMHGYGLKGRFFKNMFFFAQGICTFFVSCFYTGGKMLIFCTSIFFGFTRVSFKKQKKKLSNILRLKNFRKLFVTCLNFRNNAILLMCCDFSTKDK